MLIHCGVKHYPMPTGDFDPFDHFGHDRMNMKDGDKGSIKSERVMLRVGFFILWIFFAIVYPYLDYGFIDWDQIFKLSNSNMSPSLPSIKYTIL